MMELLDPHPLDKRAKEAGKVLENTICNSVKLEKEATSVVEEDTNEFVCRVHPIIIAENCIHDGKLRLTPMIGSPAKE